jgi:hypothetical protein
VNHNLLKIISIISSIFLSLSFFLSHFFPSPSFVIYNLSLSFYRQVRRRNDVRLDGAAYGGVWHVVRSGGAGSTAIASSLTSVTRHIDRVRRPPPCLAPANSSSCDSLHRRRWSLVHHAHRSTAWLFLLSP